jgi:biopolymer transport protein ExbD
VEAAPVVPPVVVSISAGGALFWDGTPIAESELHGRLALLRESAPDPRVLVAGDRHASYRTAVAVLDAVRAAGIASVSVETRVRPSVH